MVAPRRVVLGTDVDRVAGRLCGFVIDLLRHVGADVAALTADLPSIDLAGEPNGWVGWNDYITLAERLGVIVGGAEGVARTMRATLPSAYAELRAFAGFFPGPVPFFAFVTHQLNRELIPSAWGLVEEMSPTTFRVRYRIDDSLRGSELYLHGTATLIEVFPTHVGLPEGTVKIVSLTDRTAEFEVEFPAVKPKLRWGSHLMTTTAPSAATDPATTLTHREREVLELVCAGLTNAQIAAQLGTAASTVKSQISSILAKMDVANRTELAAVVSRRS